MGGCSRLDCTHARKFASASRSFRASPSSSSSAIQPGRPASTMAYKWRQSPMPSSSLSCDSARSSMDSSWSSRTMTRLLTDAIFQTSWRSSSSRSWPPPQPQYPAKSMKSAGPARPSSTRALARPNSVRYTPSTTAVEASAKRSRVCKQTSAKSKPMLRSRRPSTSPPNHTRQLGPGIPSSLVSSEVGRLRMRPRSNRSWWLSSRMAALWK
mmetsp:Transcript_88627/g.271312  ORF Transcript_88627/g.271312 Transcript_88627/m.271312 type:complete len:211 (-) Transcript_88627:175-807(-)